MPWDLPYLTSTAIAALVLVTVAAAMPRHRRIAFFSGGVLTAAAPMAASYGDYWSPERMAGFPLGPADFLYSFSVGLMTWLIVAAADACRGLAVRWATGQILWRGARVFAAVTTLHFGLILTGIESITSSMLGMTITGVALLILRPWLWPLAVPATLAYPVLHCLALALAFRFWPRLPSYWHADQFWTTPFLLGVPLGEFAFHAVMGFAWPVMTAYLLDARPHADSRAASDRTE